MPSRYSVLRYVADERTEEFVNIGIVVVDGKRAYCQIAPDLRRGARFAGVSVGLLRECAEQIKAMCESLYIDDEGPLNGSFEGLDFAYSKWRNIVQLSKPRGSSGDAFQTLSVASKIFFRAQEDLGLVEEDKDQGKLAAVRLTVKSMRRHLQSVPREQFRVLTGTKAVVYAQTSKGEPYPLRMDCALQNGAVKLGGFGLSLALSEGREAEEHVDVIATRVVQIRSQLGSIPFCATCLDYEEASPVLQSRAESILGDVNCALLLQSEVEPWISNHMSSIIPVDSFSP